MRPMTNLEKITALCLFPVKSANLLSCLEDREIVSTATYDPTNDAEVKAMQLCRADVFVLLLSAPGSIGEGGYSLSAPDMVILKSMANAIYSKYGEISPLTKGPSVKAKHPW
jgi:hypothetical protein